MDMKCGFRPTVNIMLSTYNGEHFLRELLDSLISQDYPRTFIHIRDDGSEDHTPKILAEYSRRCSNMLIQYGENNGVVASYMELLRSTTGSGALYAFCDQDDIWLPDKISRAVDRLSHSHDPSSALYCSRLEFIDFVGSSLGLSRVPRVIGFRNAIVENIAVGCTLVFGEAIRYRLLQANPEEMLMHDWWAYLTASAFGEVVYDPSPTIYYRRHHSNATTLQIKNTRNLSRRARGWFDFILTNRRFQAVEQAERFAALYHDLPHERRNSVQQLTLLRKSNFVYRLMHVLALEASRNDPVENLGIRCLMLMGRF